MPPAPIFSRMRYEPSVVRPGSTSGGVCPPPLRAARLRGGGFAEEDFAEGDFAEDDFAEEGFDGRVLKGESGASAAAGCSPVWTSTSTSRRSSSSPEQASARYASRRAGASS